MNPVTLPRAPNWCLNNILVCANDGTVAWGAKNEIVIITPSPDKEEIINYKFIPNAHTERVSCLAFSPNYGKDNDMFLLSGGDDNVVKIWNLSNLTIHYANSILESKQKVVGVDWFKADPNIMCYVSEDGSLVCCNVPLYHNYVINLGKMIATCLSCCPHNKFTVAVGTKCGLVCIIDTRRPGSIVYKLRSHNSQIVSLSWCPVPTNIFHNNESNDLLLASGAKDRNIYFWRAGKDGRYEHYIKVPTQTLDNNTYRTKQNPADRYWIALNWVTPTLLLSSSSWSELISWDLSPTNKKQTYQIVHTYHGRSLYCIATVPVDFQQENIDWRTRNNITVWTVSQDRQVICCDIQNNKSKLKYNIPTQGGYIYCMAACPLDTSQIAFGCGDKMLRLWNLSEPHKNIINISIIWQKIMGKIRAIAWHPEKENLLAFGTEEGRVGVIDTNSSRPPILYRQYFTYTIYSIEWGPVSNHSNFGLYACGYDKLVIYDSDKPEKDPTVVLSKTCTQFSWKPDYSCMVVGLDDGSIKFYTNSMQCVKTVKVLNKIIYCLVWHPVSTASDTAMSSMQNYLAVSGDSTIITIFDVLPINSENQVDQNGTSLHKTVATLKGHTEKVVTLAWSPFITGQLLSGSYDGTIQVWKVETQEIMRTFTGHNSAVLCCMWSPLDPEYVISGSVDFTVRIWKLSDQTVVLPESKQKKSKSKKIKSKTTNLLNEGKVKDNVISTESNENELEKNVKVTSSEQLKTENKPKNKSSEKESLHLFRNVTRNKKSLLCSIRNILNGTDNTVQIEEDENTLASLVAAATLDEDDEFKDSDDDENSSIFYDKNTTLGIVAKEQKRFKERGCRTQGMELDVWKNQLKQSLDEAIKDNKLDDYLVSLTPSLSFKVWQETCMAYSMQLISKQNYTKAVSYLLVINKIQEAIDVYINARKYKEAYILATCRLDANDPLLTKILEDWANYSYERGCFEESALCLTKLGDYATAAKHLSRRENNLESLKLAIELAVASKDNDLMEFLIEQAIKKSLLSRDFELAQSLVKRYPQVNYQELLVEVRMKISDIYETTPLNSSSIFERLMYGSKLCQNGLIKHFEELYGKERLEQFHTELQARDFSIDITSKSSLSVYVSHYLSLAISTNSKETRIKYIVTALGAISHFELSNHHMNEDEWLLLPVILSLDSTPLSCETNLFNDYEFESSKSLRAYLCLAILKWYAKAEDPDCTADVALVLAPYIPSIFDQKAVNYWTINTKINKIETELSTIIGKTKVTTQESETNNEDKVQELIAKMNQMKLEKKEFTDLRVCTPSPVVIYCMALEFGSKIESPENAEEFNNTINELWKQLQI